MKAVTFIQQDGSGRALSEKDRRIVRNVSNRAGAATRKARGGKIKVNQLQLPDFLLPDIQTGFDARNVPQKVVHAAGNSTGNMPDQALKDDNCPNLAGGTCDRCTISVSLSLWPNSKAPEHVSLLMQPGLSQSLLLSAARAKPNSEPRRWCKICRLSSTLQFLPLMLGHSKALDSAIGCLAEKVRQFFIDVGDLSSAKLRLERGYGDALRALQNTISARNGVDWTVWYTTLILALFEV
jgi:hypothetical protein